MKLAVDRSTHASKLRDFREWMDAVKKDTLHRVSIKGYPYLKLGPVIGWVGQKLIILLPL